jgi:hypothetical protein
MLLIKVNKLSFGYTSSSCILFNDIYIYDSLTAHFIINYLLSLHFTSYTTCYYNDIQINGANTCQVPEGDSQNIERLGWAEGN